MMEPTPLRPDEQVAGGYLVMSLGDQPFEVNVLAMWASRKWLQFAKDAVARMKGTAEGLDSFEDVADFIAGQSEAMMDLLIEYDRLGTEEGGNKRAEKCPRVLPEREWIDTHATDAECYDGWKRVTAATSPLAQEALRIFPDLIPVLIEAFKQAVSKGTAAAMIAMASSKSTNGSQPSTAGPPTSSTEPSPTSSSPSTPRRARSGAIAKRGRSKSASSTA